MAPDAIKQHMKQVKLLQNCAGKQVFLPPIQALLFLKLRMWAESRDRQVTDMGEYSE